MLPKIALELQAFEPVTDIIAGIYQDKAMVRYIILLPSSSLIPIYILRRICHIHTVIRQPSLISVLTCTGT